MRSRTMAWLRAHPVASGALVVASVGLGVVLLAWILPSVLTRRPAVTGAERHKAIADVRSGLVALVGAIGIAGGLAYTARSFRITQTAHLTGRFQEALKHLGDDNSTVRFGAIEALALLADDWTKQRQRCINVLCTYVATATAPGDSTKADDAKESRRRAVDVIVRRLRPGTSPTWLGCDFDFAHGTFDFNSADFRGLTFSKGRFSFAGATFTGTVRFDESVFDGATFDFTDADFENGCKVTFNGSTFSEGMVSFDRADFREGSVSFGEVEEPEVDDSKKSKGSTFGPGCEVTFAGARFGVGVHFDRSLFGSEGGGAAGITFAKSKFSSKAAEPVTFREARFFSKVDFDGAEIHGPVDFRDACFGPAGRLSLTNFHLHEDMSFERAHRTSQSFAVTGAHKGLGHIRIDMRSHAALCKVCNQPVGEPAEQPEQDPARPVFKAFAPSDESRH